MQVAANDGTEPFSPIQEPSVNVGFAQLSTFQRAFGNAEWVASRPVTTEASCEWDILRRVACDLRS
jgi:hypothetical protein